MAKNYIDNLSEETKKGMLQKASEGYYPGIAPLGYKNIEIKKEGTPLRIIEIDNERVPIIQKLFRLYATGEYSLRALTKIAYEEGLRNRYGKKVGISSIDRILKNPFYYGYFKWANELYKGKILPLFLKSSGI